VSAVIGSTFFSTASFRLSVPFCYNTLALMTREISQVHEILAEARNTWESKIDLITT
jgi:hypothetical protein